MDGFTRWYRGSDQEVIDRYLEGLAGKAAAAGLCVLPPHRAGTTIDWRGVSGLPGVRLTQRSREITSASGEVLLTRQRRTVTLASGKVFRLERWRPLWLDEEQELSDAATAEPVLWLLGSHFEREAGDHVLFSGRRYLTFPISGGPPRDSVMTAVSESGSTVLWFRTCRPAEQEVIVSPDCDLTPEILCVVALAGPWRSSYFDSHPGGGG